MFEPEGAVRIRTSEAQGMMFGIGDPDQQARYRLCAVLKLRQVGFNGAAQNAIAVGQHLVIQHPDRRQGDILLGK